MSERKLTMVVNPHGGVKQARQILEQVRPIFEAAGVSLEVHETEYRNHAEELARELDLSGAYGLCAIGGDGTFHEVINGMMVRPESERLPIGILAAGSGNTFLDTCDLLDPLAAAEGMAQGRTRPIDLARVELSDQVRYACNIVGWGLVTDIGIRSEQYRWTGTSRYTIASAIEVLRGRKRRARLVIDGEVIEDDFSFILGMNTKYTGKGMLMAPDADLTDGLIDLIIVRSAPRLKILLMLPKVFDGSHIGSPLLEYRQVPGFELHPEEPETLNIDGELRGTGSMKVTMLQGGFQLLG